MAATKGGEDGGGASKLAAQKAAIEAERDASLSATNVELEAKRAAFVAESSAAGLTQQKNSELLLEYLGALKTAGSASAQINAAADAQIVTADREATNERLAIAKSFHSAIDKAAMDGAQQEAQLTLKAQEQAAKNELALHHGTTQQIAAAEVAANKAETQFEVDAFNVRLKNLDTFDKNYLKNWVELEAEKTKVTQKAEADQTAIMVAAAQKQAMEIQQAETKMKDAIASDVANSIVMNKSLAASFEKTGEQMAEQLIKNLIMMELTADKTKLINADEAAAKSFDWASTWGGPAAGYAAAALAFAGVMSFEQGGKIPGDGAVPIVGHAGETVVTKTLTDRVEAAERGGNNGASGQTHIHFAPQIHAMDAEGVDRVLAKHSAVFQRHVGATLRRMNK